MGLEVTAIQHARFIHSKRNCRQPGHCRITSERVFAKNLDGKKTGCYVSANDAYADYRVGSCGSFNKWRALLADMFMDASLFTVWDNPEPFRDKPFFGLIHMSDCKGAIGPLTSQKLAQDFVRFRKSIAGRWKKTLEKPNNNWLLWDSEMLWLRCYDEWSRICTFASEDGFIHFT